ncbi:uncharacterized protein LOC135211533 [Macrobrachium nipponense]|uniref:uncharacterized protein LOC135211533 n=1 Tax=Macrobrachium nipponense TaxID=159736 RepID=UPI0030C7F968
MKTVKDLEIQKSFSKIKDEVSSDGSDGSENEFLPQKEVSSSSSDSDDYQDSEDESTRQASTSSDIQASTSTDRNTIITRHGIAWEPLSSSRKGRYSQSQVFKATSGISKTVKNVAAESPYSAWRIFIDETMLRKIHKWTISEGKNHDESWVLSLEKFEAYIALTYARRVYGKAHSADFLWNKTYGPKIFGETMSRSDYKKIHRFIRFDNRSTRSERIKSDKFTHIRDIFDLFVENCRGAYIPTYSLTIDEQLCP